MPWSDDLEQLNADTDTHWIDDWTRAACLREFDAPTSVLDIGCGSGALLVETERRFPGAALTGVDDNAAAAARAQQRIPSASVLQADAAALPFPDGSFDAVLCTNVLEHIDDDSAVLTEIRRVLAPDGRAVVVVPYGPALFDYYDEHLGHVRRYGRGELAATARAAGLTVIDDFFIGSLPFPAFWLVKKAHRIRRPTNPELRVRVAIKATSPAVPTLLARAARAIEGRLPGLPFGIRSAVVVTT